MKEAEKTEKTDWVTWSEWVKDGIRENRETLKFLQVCVTQLKIDMKVQQVKAGIWGMVGAAIPSATLLFFAYLKGLL